jgi:hypothetical protein
VKLSAFLAFAAAAFGVFGAGLALAPGAFMRPFGLGFDPPGALMARVLGSALLGFALALWLSRDAGPAPVRPLLIGGLAYNLVDLPINVVAIQAGTMNALAWITVGLHVALAVGFGWFAFSRSAA